MQDYSSAAAHAGVSMLAINAGQMPPWKANNSCNEYHGDRSLTEEQKTIFSEWTLGGMPEGDAANEGAPLDLQMPGLTRVDATLAMAEAYTPTLSPDDYRCFLLPWPEEFTSDKFVTGFKATPGNAKIVHHVIAFIAGPLQRDEYLALDAAEDGPGYTCFGGSGGSAQASLGSWVPGTQGTDYPAGTGIKVTPGSTIVLQVHYNAALEAAEVDQTTLSVRLEDSVPKQAALMGWLDPQWLGGSMPIAAGDAAATHSFTFSPVSALQFLGATTASEITLYNAGLHMHRLGTKARLEVTRASGEKECLLQIDDWDFNWQGDYELREPMRLAAGDQLRIDCEWDNSATNQPIVDGSPLPPRNVNWGEGTHDEMCLGSFFWTE
jgi:hypothetical protein